MTTLVESYAACRELNRRYGTTYYLSTFLLPRIKRHHVHALYGFCRYADDIVDADVKSGDSTEVVHERAAALAAFGERFFADLERGHSDDRVLKAVVHTVRAFNIDRSCFRRFLHSMAMDLDTTEYETFDDLLEYMDGSAAVIGEMMLPVLEPFDLEAATGPARDLGIAFQLTNFLRDVDEDLSRGRVYLPQIDVKSFEAREAFASRLVTPEFVALMRFEAARTRTFYASAARGISMLPPESARCIRAAHRLYARILDAIEANGYDVFSERARVPSWKKVVVAAGSMRR